MNRNWIICVCRPEGEVARLCICLCHCGQVRQQAVEQNNPKRMGAPLFVLLEKN